MDLGGFLQTSQRFRDAIQVEQDIAAPNERAKTVRLAVERALEEGQRAFIAPERTHNNALRDQRIDTVWLHGEGLVAAFQGLAGLVELVEHGCPAHEGL